MRRLFAGFAAFLMDGATDGSGGAGGAGAPAPATGAAAAVPLTAQQLQSITAPIVQAVQNQVAQATQAVATVQTQVTALTTRLDQLSQPRTNASQLFGGGAPAVQTGERALTSRGYQYFRALGFRQGFLRADECKVELDMHQRLHSLYEGQGFRGDGSNSILCPLGSGMLLDSTQGLGTEVRQSLAAGIAGYDPDRAAAMSHAGRMQTSLGVADTRQALSQFDDTGAGVFLGPTQRGEMIDLLRNREVFSRVGATQLTLPPNGRLRFDKQTGATTAYWGGEVPSNKSTPAMTASEPTTGFMELLAKKLYVLCKLPNELLRFSTPELEMFFRNDMAKVMSLESDRAMLEGLPNGLSIKGLLYYSGVLTHIAGTVATDGNTFEPEDVNLMLADLEDQNHDPESPSFAWVMRGRMWANLLNRRAAAHTAGTYDGDWLFPVNRSDIANGSPSRLNGGSVVRSNQVSKTRAKGSATDLTYVLAGIFEHYLIARVGVIEFATSTQGDTPFTTDQTWVRAIQHMDAGPRYENAFNICDSLDMDLP